MLFSTVVIGLGARLFASLLYYPNAWNRLHLKVLLNIFQLKGHTLGFHPDSKGTATFIESRFDSGSERVKILTKVHSLQYNHLTLHSEVFSATQQVK